MRILDLCQDVHILIGIEEINTRMSDPLLLSFTYMLPPSFGEFMN